jgi:hypothetical protein
VFKQIAERAATYLSIPPEDGTAFPTPENFVAPDGRPLKTARARTDNKPTDNERKTE